mmetsp:Transcript_51395/g.95023  ORF Transcript_51395/g.95023 Transcript_51395/m.95023 type:complete len:136 (-) Transcript_51395:2039-2446(-)
MCQLHQGASILHKHYGRSAPCVADQPREAMEENWVSIAPRNRYLSSRSGGGGGHARLAGEPKKLAMPPKTAWAELCTEAACRSIRIDCWLLCTSPHVGQQRSWAKRSRMHLMQTVCRHRGHTWSIIPPGTLQKVH